MLFVSHLACVAGGSGCARDPFCGPLIKPAREFPRAARPRAKFLPASLLTLFECRPLLSLANECFDGRWRQIRHESL